MVKPSEATARAGHTSHIFFQPQNMKTITKGMISEKTQDWRPTIWLKAIVSSPVEAARVVIGMPNAPKATVAVSARSDRPEAARGKKPVTKPRAVTLSAMSLGMRKTKMATVTIANTASRAAQ